VLLDISILELALIVSCIDAFRGVASVTKRDKPKQGKLSDDEIFSRIRESRNERFAPCFRMSGSLTAIF
jgi:hypothetical protein